LTVKIFRTLFSSSALTVKARIFLACALHDPNIIATTTARMYMQKVSMVCTPDADQNFAHNASRQILCCICIQRRAHFRERSLASCGLEAGNIRVAENKGKHKRTEALRKKGKQGLRATTFCSSYSSTQSPRQASKARVQPMRRNC
jgi:hypothetical protein